MDTNPDYIVIGSGVCAFAFVKRTLAHNPIARITIIERGGILLEDHFQNVAPTLGPKLAELVEFRPWRISTSQSQTSLGGFQWQHGIIPYLGGESTFWSGWCPRPTAMELGRWPTRMAEAARRNFEAAENLLGVVSADRLQHPLYSTMQRALQKMLMDNLSEIGSAESCSPAALAVGLGSHLAKFSVPTRLLRLATHKEPITTQGPCVPLHLLTNRTVTRLILEGSRVTALDTSRGRIEAKGAEIVLAIGTIPATTLLLNSLPQPHLAGTRYTAHFTSLIVARVPRREYAFGCRLDELEMAAIYVSGGTDAVARAEYHVQLTVLHDRDPIRNAETLARYVPDPMATATLPQLAQSTDHLVFIVAVLGELDNNNPDNCLRLVEGADLSTNVALSVHANDQDYRTWQAMDQAAFEMLENALSPRGRSRVEYWHGTPDAGSWQRARPVPQQRRLPGLVHEASTLWVGEADDGVVGLDYRPQCLENVYVTGGSLWPTAGSFNPTLTMVALAQDLADQLSRRRLKQS